MAFSLKPTLIREITTSTSAAEAEEIRQVNMLADAIVLRMKRHDLPPGTWEEISEIVQKTINKSTHITWKD